MELVVGYSTAVRFEILFCIVSYLCINCCPKFLPIQTSSTELDPVQETRLDLRGDERSG